MASESIEVRWKGFGKYIRDSCKDLYNSREEDGDITLVCGEEFVKAHKIVLFVGSNYFRNALQKLSSSHSVHYFKGVDSSTMNTILRYLYLGEMVVEEDNLDKVLEACGDLGISSIEPELISPKTEAGIKCPPKLRNKQVARSFTSFESSALASKNVVRN